MALPSGYKPVEYITCAGKQWFDTGIAPSANLAVEICVKPASAGLKENAIFGASWNVDGFFLMFYNNQVKFHSKGTDATTSGFDATVKSVIRCTQTSLVVNGTSYSLNGSGSDVTYNISMFTVTNSGVGSNNAAMYGDCYYCKMWQGTTLVRDYQPCLNSSGVPGMYDLVNGVFYPSTSGTAFASGPITSDGRLEYIETGGAQYINTDFTPNANTRIVMDCEMLEFGTNCYYGAASLSSGASSHAQTNTVVIINGTSTRCDWYGTSVSWAGVAKGRQVLDKNKNITSINGVVVITNPASSNSCAYPMYLFARNIANSTVDLYSKMRLYSCKIYDNGVLVRDYIPFRYNNEVGLWDRVSNTFYGNSGSGVFTAGPDAVYERVEYIQSSGTQYVDTGFVPDANTRVTSMFQMVSPGTANECIFGVVGQFSFRWYGSGGYFRSNGANNANFATTIPSGARHTVTKTPTTCTIDNVYTVTNTVGTVTSSLYIFAQRGASSPTAYATAKIFSFRVFDGDALVRDYVPVVRSDGAVGLYDQLNEIFYENAGTGTFVAGPVAKYAEVEYIESTGTQYIDTGFAPNQDTRVVCKTIFEPGSTAKFLFGARSSTTSDQFSFAATSSGVYRSGYGSGYSQFSETYSNDGIIIVDKNKAATTLTLPNGTKGTVEVAESTFTAPCNMVLFAVNNNGTVGTFSNTKLYSCQIYDNDVLVRDFVPTVRADGTPGLLDQTNNAFYTNSGTGTFVVGPDLDYTKLEYIESTGTQYVDTGFIPNQDTRVVMDCQAYSVYNGGSFPFGVRASTSSKAFAVALVESQVFYNYASNYQFADYPATLERMMIDANKNVATFVGSTTATISLASGTFVCNSTLTLATFNNAGTPDVGDPAWVGAIWSCQIYDNGVLIRDYVPALRENGQIGLVDLVSGLFYANEGSGVFIAGPEIVDPDPPDPPEPPGPYEPPSFTEQTLAYLAALRYPFYKLCRLRFLQPDGSTAFSLDNNPKNKRSGAFIADGSISANLQNGKRRNATVVLSNLDGSFDYNVNTVWFGTEIAIDEGLILPNGSEYYIQQGVFAIENPSEAVEPANRTATYNLVDKWSYLDGTLFGNLESTYEVPVGTNIFQPIEAILALDRGNGQPVDGVTPIFTEYYNSKTQALPDGSTANLIDSPYTLRIDSNNGTYADVLLGLAAMVNAWIGYDQTGALRIDPSQDDILDTNKPILWQFSMDEATFLGANYTVRNVDVYNDYIVLGELLDDNSQPAGRATNLDPRSDTNVQTIGRKTFRMSAPGFATDKQCQDLAVWKLKRSTSLQKAISISCSQLFHIEENGLVTIVRTDKPGSPVERHLVMGFTRPLTSNGEMQINAVSVQDFVTATVTSWPE